MASLAETAEQHARAPEKSLQEAGIRQCAFGLGRTPSHRILYAIRGDDVVIYRVRALKQADLAPSELTG